MINNIQTNRERERIRKRNTDFFFNKALKGCKHNKPCNAMYTQYSICWRWNVANEQAEAKRYLEENITILPMIISSSHSYVYHILFKFCTIAGFFFCWMLYTQTKQDFSGRVQRERERERKKNSNSKTLFDKDCSLGSVKNLTSPC